MIAGTHIRQSALAKAVPTIRGRCPIKMILQRLRSVIRYHIALFKFTYHLDEPSSYNSSFQSSSSHSHSISSNSLCHWESVGVLGDNGTNKASKRSGSVGTSTGSMDSIDSSGEAASGRGYGGCELGCRLLALLALDDFGVFVHNFQIR